MLSNTQFISFFIALTTITISVINIILKAGENFDAGMTQDAKEVISEKIDQYQKYLTNNPRMILVVIFNKLFDEDHLSIKCLAKSVVFSVLSVIVLVSLFVLGNVSGDVGYNDWLKLALIVGIISLFVNAIPNYFSLFVVRRLVNMIASGTGFLFIVFLSIIPVSAISSFIVAPSLIILLEVPFAYDISHLLSLYDYDLVFKESIILIKNNGNISIEESVSLPLTLWFWAGFSPLIILAISWVGVFFIRMLIYFQPWQDFLLRNFNTRKSPNLTGAIYIASIVLLMYIFLATSILIVGVL
uniref:Uncharacterized protein n=1 Tax=Candidatus Kentrum sp. LFY TaxID=2126342 RepID=A0A450UBE0_9GAMM|nr:MAG: hypothetical protein BECKLFY1418B_GA0070995_101610 [Candidatus Kentron sp. LFY]